MRKLNLNAASAYEVIEHLLVGYTKEELVQLMKDVQRNWNKMAPGQWCEHINGARIFPEGTRGAK